MADPFNLQRFLDAQARDYAQAMREIKNGRKQSHWIWYIFPKLEGGHSDHSKYYGISGMDEAKAYYDLYHTGNWNAKHAIERGGFNLNV